MEKMNEFLLLEPGCCTPYITPKIKLCYLFY